MVEQPMPPRNPYSFEHRLSAVTSMPAPSLTVASMGDGVNGPIAFLIGPPNCVAWRNVRLGLRLGQIICADRDGQRGFDTLQRVSFGFRVCENPWTTSIDLRQQSINHTSVTLTRLCELKKQIQVHKLKLLS